MQNAVDMRAYGLTPAIEFRAAQYKGYTLARVVSQEKGLYRIVSEAGEKKAGVSGRFMYNAAVVSEYPAVGDFVMADINEGGNAVIHHVLERSSCFIRKAAGSSRKEQVVAANIDTLFLCMALNNDFNVRRMERYLSIAWDSGANPVIVLTKSDLCGDIDQRVSEIEGVAFGVDILVTTAMEDDGYQKIMPYIREGRTVAFIGSSGVGKSTLINRLIGEERLLTNGLRDDDKGRHTTTHRELILIPDGGMVIDTPGMRELGMWDSSEGVERTFSDVEALTGKCRFRDCTHGREPGCAVRAALESGELSYDRWDAYQHLMAENAYAADSESYMAAKKQKFKDIAKYNKNNKKR